MVEGSVKKAGTAEDGRMTHNSRTQTTLYIKPKTNVGPDHSFAPQKLATNRQTRLRLVFVVFLFQAQDQVHLALGGDSRVPVSLT